MTRVGRFELDNGAQLGQGGYGVVVKATDPSTGERVAAKMIDKRKMKSDAIEKEVMLMKMMKHPNVIAVIEQVELDKSMFIFMELASAGELFGRVIQSGSLREEEARPYFTQLIGAVKYMHTMGIAHRDLKLENVLLSSDGHEDICKVCDFGLAYRYEVDGAGKVLKGRPLMETCGSKSYAAPEVLEGRGYDGFDADVWSCGICLFAMLAGFFPLDEASGSDWRFERVKLNAANGSSTCVTIFGFYERSCTLSKGVTALIDSMLSINPERRLTVEGVFSSEWVTNGPQLTDMGNVYRSGAVSAGALTGDQARALIAAQEDEPMAPLYRGGGNFKDGPPPMLCKQPAMLCAEFAFMDE